MSRCPHGRDDEDCAMFKCSSECAQAYLKLYPQPRQEDPVTDLMKLVIALVEENVVAQFDAEGAMYALVGLQELEKQGWKFVPPPSPLVDNSDPT